MRSSDEDERRVVEFASRYRETDGEGTRGDGAEKVFSARQKPNNALCFGLTRFAKGRDQRMREQCRGVRDEHALGDVVGSHRGRDGGVVDVVRERLCELNVVDDNGIEHDAKCSAVI